MEHQRVESLKGKEEDPNLMAQFRTQLKLNKTNQKLEEWVC